MMSYLDVKYIQLLSPSLEKFKQNHTNLWNFRCPECGDSKKHKNKRRGFIDFDTSRMKAKRFTWQHEVTNDADR